MKENNEPCASIYRPYVFFINLFTDLTSYRFYTETEI